MVRRLLSRLEVHKHIASCFPIWLGLNHAYVELYGYMILSYSGCMVSMDLLR